MADETLGWATFIVAALSAVFIGITALKQVTVAKTQAIGLRKLVTCPNCGQPFDASLVQGFSPGKYLRLYNGLVTCPRCTFTFEA